MTRDRHTVGARIGSIVLVLLTMGAIVFGVINLQQRLSFDVPDDGVSWSDNEQGLQAKLVAPNSPAQRAGIKSGDVLVSIDGQPLNRAIDVTKRLWGLGIWSQARYEIRRQNRTLATKGVTAPAPQPK